MNKFTAWAIGVSVFLILSTCSVYNGMSQKEEAVYNAFGNLDSALQRRYDLIPNLVSAVKGYAAHESKTLQAVVEARSQIGSVSLDASKLNDEKAIAQFMAKQNQLQGSLHRLLAVVEAYPDLKANQNFLDLQHQLEGTENRINYSRTQMNKAVQDFNYSIRKFPNSLVNAVFAQLEKKCFFQATEEVKLAPKVEFNNKD